jgi:4-hydroxythreonine-4-phosphate dehydrogenase
MKTRDLPLIGITMGDPVGIGPEIIAKALADPSVHAACRPVIFGDEAVLVQAMHTYGNALILQACDTIERRAPGNHIELVPVSHLDHTALQPGRPTRESSAAMAAAITEAVGHAVSGRIDAVVTAPINKQALNQAGFNYPGHTEMLARLTNTPEVVMMLAGERLRVALVTIHCALKDVPGLLSTASIVTTASITREGLRRYFTPGSEPRIAVAALNPHAGEGSLFGSEERDIITPAIEQLRARGIDATGPHPPDTVFHAAARDSYDAVICMYHDQGLIPLKLLHFDNGVNITLGLPIIRTSVDHGTAYDIAGRGQADPSSLISAIRTAAAMATAAR